MQQPLYGLIGGKLGHSYSKIIHEKIADYTYELLPLPTEAEARTFMERRAFAAINVTIPYKQFVIPYCDVVDPKAQAIGAVNTIVNRDGKLYGYNTDYAGFAYLAGAHGVDFAGKTVLILGTGGTHSTVTAVCRDGGAKEILTASRTGKGDALLYSEAMHRPDVQIIVNTTPCGMFPNVGQCLIDPKAFPALEAVLDVVYNPFRTELLLRAEDCGVTAAGGFEMLVAQAVFAAEHFTGRQLDTAAIIPAVSRELRHQLANVSIIGMPGCGKSTVGAALAKRLDKKFVDLDAEIERRTGHNIPDIFAQEGEAAFRRYETDVLANPWVENVTRVSAPYKRANRLFHPEDTVVDINGVRVGGNAPIAVMAGPCSIEGEEHTIKMAKAVKAGGANFLRGGAYKPRTSPYSFQGLGTEGILDMVKAREITGLPIVSELMDEVHIPEFEEYVDVVQIGARNMQNFQLLKAVGKMHKPVLLKRGLANTIEEWIMSAEYIMAGGNENVILCERGIRTFERATRNTLDLSAVPVIKEKTHLPIIVDPSHATGDYKYIESMALAAVAAGADGLEIEVHNDPPHAWSDGAQCLKPDKFADVIAKCRKVAAAIGREM